jgi:maltooligosyltrehalose trehalohydrolase
MTLHLLSGDGVRVPMTKDTHGYFFIDVPNAGAGARYLFAPDDGEAFPDPASNYQPEGVGGPSEVVDHNAFSWSDGGWRGLPFEELVFYEVHVGAFTPGGTFVAMIDRLDDLVELGVNAVELMPVAQWSGNRNWGYDGVFLYAVQNGYGGPEGLKRLVDACHLRGIAVFLDVVYNHVGSEGNCLDRYGPYFTDKYQTPWGKAINYDGAWSDGVREFVTGNVLYWAEHYHFDGLRLDAVHEIYDRNAVRIWDQLYATVKRYEERAGRRCYLVAESDGNDPRVVRPPGTGGHGFDAQWLDDFHHALYVFIDRKGWKHYQDFGRIDQVAKAFSEGFVHTGEFVKFRHRMHGASSAGIGGHHFVVFNQNHDLPGNRPGGERLAVLTDMPSLKLAAAAMILSPYVPMLFMGEEYGEETPFYFFSDYQQPETIANLMEGRKQQFALFDWDGQARDPQDEQLFLASKLQWARRREGKHALLLRWHRDLIRLRRAHPLLRDLSRNRLRADVIGTHGLAVYRYSADRRLHLLCLFNFSFDAELTMTIGYAGLQKGQWRRLLTTHDGVPELVATGGTVTLPPQNAVVYELRAHSAEDG